MKILLLKRIETVFLLFVMVLFAHFSFSFPGGSPGLLDNDDTSGATLCRSSVPKCPHGQQDIFISPSTCICVDVNNCPAGATHVKRPIPISDSYSIHCGHLRYMTNDGLHLDNFPSDRLDEYIFPRSGGGVGLVGCWADIHINRKSDGSDETLDKYDYECGVDYATNNFYRCQGRPNSYDCAVRNGKRQTLRIYTSCAWRDVDKCRKTLQDMIAGKITFPKDQPMRILVDPRRTSNPYIQKRNCCHKQNPNGSKCSLPEASKNFNVTNRRPLKKHPNWSCHYKLFNRETDTDTGEYISLYASEIPIIQEGTRPAADMQCLANNIKFKNVCECDNGDYEFRLDEPGSCLCPDGVTPKPADGVCPAGTGECPSGCQSIQGNCHCTVACPDNPPTTCPGTYSVTVAPADPASSHPDSVSNPPGANDCPCSTPLPSNQCPNVTDPTVHSPQVTNYSTTNTNANDIDARCPNGGTSITRVSGVDYCVKDQTCTDSTDEQVCASETTVIDYGKCNGTPGVVQKVCMDNAGGNDVLFDPSNTGIDASCPTGWVSEILNNVHAVCYSPNLSHTIVISPPASVGSCSVVSSFPYVKLDQDNPQPGCASGKITVRVGQYDLCADAITNSEVAGNNNLSGAPGVTYSCDKGGIPSAQNDSCECKTEAADEGCDHLGPDYIRQADVDIGSCNCPTGWGTPDSNGICSKTAVGSSTTTTDVVMYEGNYDGDGRPLRRGPHEPYVHPDTYVSTDSYWTGWSCAVATEVIPHNNSSGVSRIHSEPVTAAWDVATCTKSVTTKPCPDGGRYNTSTQQCEMFCTSGNDVQNCKCVKRTENCRCGVSWTQVGNDCHQRALAVTSIDRCECKCFNGQRKDQSFKPGDDTDQIIKADPAKCTNVSANQCPPPTPPPPCCQINVTPNVPHDPCPVPISHAGYIEGNCPVLVDELYGGGDPKGIDIGFGSQFPSSFYSVYSLGSVDRPDYICWERDDSKNPPIRVQRRDLMCPPEDDCGGGPRNSGTLRCQCQTFDNADNKVLHPNTSCEYASKDPMRLEGGIIKGDLPSSRKNKKYQTDIRFFKTNSVVTP